MCVTREKYSNDHQKSELHKKKSLGVSWIYRTPLLIKVSHSFYYQKINFSKIKIFLFTDHQAWLCHHQPRNPVPGGPHTVQVPGHSIFPGFLPRTTLPGNHPQLMSIPKENGAHLQVPTFQLSRKCLNFLRFLLLRFRL